LRGEDLIEQFINIIKITDAKNRLQ
jgi:hypothetical protein